ncbi:hypothetical protein G5714_001970 [Onychostoma macrolepis]|uniref:Ig-like domain-containing protein n=1 Tax=Onychostoma macrolepis TaxID=369639 RepID=A0A7J6DDL9_9TELE|nr:hypothetical protein G5714_001970 [Onychostoma macrolepis]
MLPLVFIIFSLLKENAGEDVIKPVLTEKQVLEGKDVTLICSYTGTVQSLQWYRQYPGSKPEHLILFYETILKSEPALRLNAAADKAAKSESNGNVIRPNQPSVVLTEGSSTALSCSYDGSAYSLHWYRQKPGSKPEFLLLIVKSTKTVVPASPPHPHMSITLHDNKSVNLKISSAAVSDSAVYYCALQPTVTGKPTTLYKNLLVICLLHSHISLP